MSLEFRCRDVGVVCKEKVTGETPEELLTEIAKHADNAHGVPKLSETLVDYALTVVKEK